MQLKVSKEFQRDVKRLSTITGLAEWLQETIAMMEVSDNISAMHNVKKMKGSKDFYRVRFKDYRLGFHYKGDVVLLLRLMHRKDIYKYFPPE